MKADGSAFSARLLSAKEAALMSQGNGGIDGALSCVQSAAMDAIASLGGEFTIATIVLFDGVVEIPVTVALPQAITGGLTQAVQHGVDSLRRIALSVTEARQWE